MQIRNKKNMLFFVVLFGTSNVTFGMNVTFGTKDNSGNKNVDQENLKTSEKSSKKIIKESSKDETGIEVNQVQLQLDEANNKLQQLTGTIQNLRQERDSFKAELEKLQEFKAELEKLQEDRFRLGSRVRGMEEKVVGFITGFMNDLSDRGSEIVAQAAGVKMQQVQENQIIGEAKKWVVFEKIARMRQPSFWKKHAFITTVVGTFIGIPGAVLYASVLGFYKFYERYFGYGLDEKGKFQKTKNKLYQFFSGEKTGTTDSDELAFLESYRTRGTDLAVFGLQLGVAFGGIYLAHGLLNKSDKYRQLEFLIPNFGGIIAHKVDKGLRSFINRFIIDQRKMDKI